MHLTSQSVLKDYQALRTAANRGAQELDRSEMTGHDLEIASAQIDSDPATQDLIVASSWNGDFSSAAARLSFRELQQEGKQILEFSAEQAKGFASAEVDKSTAMIDLATGSLLSASGTGQFVISQEIAAPGTGPVTNPNVPDEQELSIRANYGELKTAVAEHKVGEEFFVESLGRQVTLEKSSEGLIGISYWGGAFSGPGSGTLTETFREFREEGVSKLHYVKVDPGDFMGNDASEVRRTLTL
jgi:hypothetical protein